MKLITAIEAANLMAISVQRVYELVRVGIIPPGVAVRLGRQVRLNEERLVEWIASGGESLPGGWRREAED